MPQKTSHRNTLQRRIILEELCAVTSHPTASELYELVRERLPKISLGTVYRNLELLTQLGVVRKLEFAGAEARFDGTVAPHHHVRCQECGQVDDIHELPADLVRVDRTMLGGYEILGHRLEFIGICPACRARAPASGPDAADG
jgi:Fur family ferric uptake transcriptional regulator